MIQLVGEVPHTHGNHLVSNGFFQQEFSLQFRIVLFRSSLSPCHSGPWEPAGCQLSGTIVSSTVTSSTTRTSTSQSATSSTVTFTSTYTGTKTSH